MAIIRMLFSLLNNPRVIEKLAESRPIRRAAQITAYALTKAQIAARDALGTTQRSGTLRFPLGMERFRKLRETFVKEVKVGWRDGSKQIKK